MKDTLVFALAIVVAVAIPVYVIGRRRDLRNPWAAFIPILGIWIVLLESIGRSGWLALLVFIPTLGPLALLIWIAIALPSHHQRSRWWTLALVVPVGNLVAYWFYAFTLPRQRPALA